MSLTASPAALPTKPLNILHIEDDHGDALLVSKALSKSGLEVGSYTHLDRLGDGLRHLRSHRVDLILLDVNLPDSAVLRFDVVAVRRCSAAPILFVTGLSEDAIAETLARGKTLAHLCKSDVSPPVIEQNIRALVSAPGLAGPAPSPTGADHRYEAVLEAMTDSVLVLDSYGQVFWANEAGECVLSDNPEFDWAVFFEHGRALASRTGLIISRDGNKSAYEARISELSDRSVGNDLFVAVLRRVID